MMADELSGALLPLTDAVEHLAGAVDRLGRAQDARAAYRVKIARTLRAYADHLRARGDEAAAHDVERIVGDETS